MVSQPLQCVLEFPVFANKYLFPFSTPACFGASLSTRISMACTHPCGTIVSTNLFPFPGMKVISIRLAVLPC